MFQGQPGVVRPARPACRGTANPVPGRRMRGKQTCNKPLMILSSENWRPALGTQETDSWMAHRTKRSNLSIVRRKRLKQQILQTTVQALGKILLNLDHGARNGALETLDPGRTVALHHNPLQAEKARTVMPGRRQVGLQTLHQGQRQCTDRT